MQRPLALALSATLAASALATVAAAPDRQGSKNCGEYDGIAVTKQETYEGPLASDSAPLLDDGSGDHLVLTDGAAENDLIVTISWEGGGDYDLYVEIDGEVVGESVGDQFGGDDPVETVTVEGVADCTEVTVTVDAYLAEPGEVDAVIELA